jgi:hypothetical protein
MLDKLALLPCIDWLTLAAIMPTAEAYASQPLSTDVEERLIERYTSPRPPGPRGFFMDSHPKPMSLPWAADRLPSSAGSLDRLPTEIIYMIFLLSNLSTLSHFAQASRAAAFLVSIFSPHRDLITHAPSALAVLAQHGLLPYFPVQQVHRLLVDERCISCASYGQFLYLPLCERVCVPCLKTNITLRVLPLETALKWFQDDDGLMRQAPIMVRSDRRGVDKTGSSRREYICVRAAAEMLLKPLHSAPSLRSIMREGGDTCWGIEGVHTYTGTNGQLVYVSFDAFSQIPSYVPGVRKTTRSWDPNGTVLSRQSFENQLGEIPDLRPHSQDPVKYHFDQQRREPDLVVPYVSMPTLGEDGKSQHGFHCRGCEWMGTVPGQDVWQRFVAPLVADGYVAADLAWVVWQRAYTRKALLKHFQVCEGVKHLEAHTDTLADAESQSNDGPR